METNDEIVNSVCHSCGIMHKINEKGIPDGAIYRIKCPKCNTELMHIKNKAIVLDCQSCGNEHHTIVRGAPYGAKCRFKCPKCGADIIKIML